jgi:predicted nucleic acid-binding Zn ribbon protein
MLFIEKIEKERKKERNKNLLCCFLFMALILLAPFIESIFNLSI